jgi:SAM-dependent methyltransferase
VIRSLLQRVSVHLPEPLRARVEAARRDQRIVRRILSPVRWGNLRRLEPVSHRWGYDRGTPIDRHYIDRFLSCHAAAIRGRVLEVKDSRYTRRYGTDVTASEVVDIDPTNPDATIVADLGVPGSLPREAFDCAVIAQTLMYLPDPATALANLWASLAPGGTLLLTTPAISRLDPDCPDEDRVHLTPRGLRDAIARSCGEAIAHVEGHGNVLAAVAFLEGISCEELRDGELDHVDALYPVVVTAVVEKPQVR